MSSVPLFAPDGSVRQVPAEQLTDALNAGGKRAVQMTDPSGTLRYVPEDQVNTANASPEAKSIGLQARHKGHRPIRSVNGRCRAAKFERYSADQCSRYCCVTHKQDHAQPSSQAAARFRTSARLMQQAAPLKKYPRHGGCRRWPRPSLRGCRREMLSLIPMLHVLSRNLPRPRLPILHPC